MSGKRPIPPATRALADKINAEALANPQSPYAGKFVGIVDGRVVAVGDTLDEVIDSLEQIEPDPAKQFWLEAGLDYDKVEEIWSVDAAGAVASFS